MVRNKLPKTTLEYLLLALVPYTEPNLKLAFRPSMFFNDLEKIARINKRTLQSAYTRAQKAGLIEFDEQRIPRLTTKGARRVQRFSAKHLGKHARLMVIFDIPEDESWKRQRLRRLLRELDFQQIQKSVWASEYDHRELLLAEVKEYRLESYIQIYESARIYPK
jgi:CRISPR-associated endonuclease Cas2